MSKLFSELAVLAGGQSKSAVSTAVQRWEDKIRERIRLEMALKLSEEASWGRQVQRVTVVVSDGLPATLQELVDALAKDPAEIAGLYKPELQSLAHNLGALTQLLEQLANLDGHWAQVAARERESIDRVHLVTTSLLELAARAAIKDALKQIEEDILGAYFPFGKPYEKSRLPVIEIYWTVIGIIARTLRVDVEGLTLTVLAHELAHAYSHLGADTDGNRWDDEAFRKAQVCIKEGIAQYYTEKTVRWLAHRNIETAQTAYTELLTIQSGPYRIHEDWIHDYSPETVRAAIIECRNKCVTETERFVSSMVEAKGRLAGPPREHDLFG